MEDLEEFERVKIVKIAWIGIGGIWTSDLSYAWTARYHCTSLNGKFDLKRSRPHSSQKNLIINLRRGFGIFWPYTVNLFDIIY